MNRRIILRLWPTGYSCGVLSLLSLYLVSWCFWFGFLLLFFGYGWGVLKRERAKCVNCEVRLTGFVLLHFEQTPHRTRTHALTQIPAQIWRHESSITAFLIEVSGTAIVPSMRGPSELHRGWEITLRPRARQREWLLYLALFASVKPLYGGLLTQISGWQPVFLLREFIIQRCLCTFVAYPHVSFYFPLGVIKVFRYPFWSFVLILLFGDALCLCCSQRIHVVWYFLR